ncbi:MAG: hypothetical protein H7A09_08900 [Oceanospirillaceae bacterium]|nr:hypothetical protein [Oceanospirillaceae bacterium]MCP5335298.1 hypothetical protein [Oceanospirillaceae bacterium]MCP5350749.1 hypothetical protein [Oceanospirillaceae bacterium]
MRISPLCYLLSASLLCACSGPALKDSGQLAQAAAAAARSQGNDNASYIEAARASQTEASQADLQLYSPTYFAQGNEALNKAVSLQEQNQQGSEIATQAILAKSLFERGMQIKPQVETQLKDCIAILEILKAIDSPNLLRDDYEDALKDFRKLATLVETNQTDKIPSEQKDLLKDLAQLEQATLTKAYVSKPAQALDEAEDDDADDYAVKTYATAEKALETLKNTISKTPRDIETIKIQSTQAVHAALHAQHVAKAAASLMNLKQKETEEKVLQTEGLLKHIADSLQMEQPVYLSLQEQAFAIAQNAEIAHDQAKSYGSQQGWAEEKQQLLSQVKNLNTKIQDLQRELNAKANPAPAETINPQLPIAETPETQVTTAPDAPAEVVTSSDTSETASPTEKTEAAAPEKTAPATEQTETVNTMQSNTETNAEVTTEPAPEASTSTTTETDKTE